MGYRGKGVIPMKRTLILITCFAFAVNLFAIRLGILQSNWQGWLQGAYYAGLRVEQTAPGYPAYGMIQPGDIITEALLIPNSQIWNTPYYSVGRFTMQLNPYVPIFNQISIPWYQMYGLQYMNTTDQNAFASFISGAMYGSNVILRIFRPGWNVWTFASVVLDIYGGGSVWMMQSPVQQGNQIAVQPNGPSQQSQIQVQTDPAPRLHIWVDIR